MSSGSRRTSCLGLVCRQVCFLRSLARYLACWAVPLGCSFLHLVVYTDMLSHVGSRRWPPCWGFRFFPCLHGHIPWSGPLASCWFLRVCTFPSSAWSFGSTVFPARSLGCTACLPCLFSVGSGLGFLLSLRAVWVLVCNPAPYGACRLCSCWQSSSFCPCFWCFHSSLHIFAFGPCPSALGRFPFFAPCGVP